MVDHECKLTIDRQCHLLEIPRSTYYYESCCDQTFYLNVMRRLDELYTTHPYYGSRRMRAVLQAEGYHVGRDLVTTLMKRMGIEAIYPKPRLTIPQPGHKIYPYLLRGVRIDRKDQVWSTDITYIRTQNGFLYLTAVIDWYCRYVLSWRLSNSLDGIFCREALLESLENGRPEIFNTDQGSQFTSIEFTEILKNKGVLISMDGRGRALDNIFIERFWRSLKQEEVYIKEYKTGLEAHQSLKEYIHFYNYIRPHMSLGYLPPAALYR
jgi:putative transposase